MKKIKILGQTLLLLMLIVGIKVNAAEVTGNLSSEIGGSSVSGNLNGGVGGSEVSGNLGGGVDNSISGTVVDGNGGGGSSSGSSSGSVLGASSGSGGNNPGQVLGVSTPGFPATGVGPSDDFSSKTKNIIGLILLLSLPLVSYSFYKNVKSI